MKTVFLGQTPILEAWIELHVQPSDTESTWPSEVDVFLEKLPSELCQREEITSQQATIRAVDPQTGRGSVDVSPPTRNRVRALDDRRSRCIQAGPDVFIYNLAKQGADYPGFENLLKQALQYFEVYITCFRPTHVRKAALHYLDLVRIPGDRTAGIRLEDYFRFGIRVPDDDTWPLSRFRAQALVPLKKSAGTDDHIMLECENRPFDETNDEFHIILNWHCVADGMKTLDMHEAEHRLRSLHDDAERLFREAVTEKLWSIFEPRKGT